jgi:hypothetical protein
MLKRGFILVNIFILILSFSIVLAQDDSVVGGDFGDGINVGDGSFDGGEGGIVVEEERNVFNIDEIEKEYSDDELVLGSGGLAPDSFFYFVDGFFDRFANDGDVSAEKVAEIKAMLEGGKTEEAREAYERYKEHVGDFEREVNPDERDETRRRVASTKRNLKIYEDENDFVGEVFEREERVLVAAEIATKVRDLCKELSELGAWAEFEKVCKTNNDDPGWQKELFKDLTNEQKNEARKFGEIMSSCFKTSGRDCNCEGIPHEGLQEMCLTASPLAVECDEGDEDSCDKLDSLEFPSDLPDYLEKVLYEVEDKFAEDSYENHIPSPCRDAGITGRGRGDRDKCFAIMIETEAPPECRDAIKSAGVRDERRARAICEEIMFKEHAPQECLNEGIDNPRECAEFMRNSFGDDFDGERFSDRPDCRNIENSKERLACYDGANLHYGERFEDRRGGGFPQLCKEAGALDRASCEKIMRNQFEDRHKETKEMERQCATKCSSQGKAWDFSSGCRCFEGKYESEESGIDCAVTSCFEGYDCIQGVGCVRSDEDYPYDCASLGCSESCSPHRGCISFDERERELEENYEYPPGPGDPGYVDETARYECSELDCGPSPNYCDPWQGCMEGERGYNPDGSSCDEGYEWSGSVCIPFGTGDYGFENNCPEGQDYDSNGICTSSSEEPSPEAPSEESPPSDESPPSEPSPTTGAFITGNAFLDYYYKWY